LELDCPDDYGIRPPAVAAALACEGSQVIA